MQKYVIANFNMSFDDKYFQKGKKYKYRNEKEKIYVQTKDGKEQEFYLIDFNTFFTFLKN